MCDGDLFLYFLFPTLLPYSSRYQAHCKSVPQEAGQKDKAAGKIFWLFLLKSKPLGEALGFTEKVALKKQEGVERRGVVADEEIPSSLGEKRRGSREKMGTGSTSLQHLGRKAHSESSGVGQGVLKRLPHPKPRMGAAENWLTRSTHKTGTMSIYGAIWGNRCPMTTAPPEGFLALPGASKTWDNLRRRILR